jgi:hypothetical protein
MFPPMVVEHGQPQVYATPKLRGRGETHGPTGKGSLIRAVPTGSVPDYSYLVKLPDPSHHTSGLGGAAR